jgi:prepilin-type N-terminal cleavage/methylation domain-containing protein
MSNKNKKGFTLIELLIVIGIIAILAGIVLVAVNPAQQFGKANDSERKSEIGTILSAIYQYQTSPTARGELPQCVTGAANTATAIPVCGTNFAGAMELGTADANYDCSTTLVPSYLRELPIDPGSTFNAANTGYYICMDDPATTTVPRIYILAPNAEVFKTDGGCMDPGTTNPAMCVSG